MTGRDFCYWLQGLFELGGTRSFDERQTDLIRRHLALVFKHEIDPSYGDLGHQAELQDIHDGKLDLSELAEEDIRMLEDLARRRPGADILRPGMPSPRGGSPTFKC